MKPQNSNLNIKTLLLVIAGALLVGASCYAEPVNLTASWYSIASLKAEGTYKYSKGVMANGKKFKDEAYTCATRLWPLASTLRITNLTTGKYVEVKVTDRIAKRFAKTRIDLTPVAFLRLAKLEKGVIPVKVEEVR